MRPPRHPRSDFYACVDKTAMLAECGQPPAHYIGFFRLLVIVK